MGGPVRKIIRATREIVATIHGEEYDVLLVPKNAMAEVDFTQFPEDDPLRRQRNVELLTKVTLTIGLDLDTSSPTGNVYLTKAGATQLLESL